MLSVGCSALLNQESDCTALIPNTNGVVPFLQAVAISNAGKIKSLQINWLSTSEKKLIPNICKNFIIRNPGV